MENKYLYTYYIGANNDTGEVERNALLTYLQDNGITGCTVRDSEGVWNGKREQSVAVEIIEDETIQDKLLELKEGLRTLLKQEAVLLTKNTIAVAW